MLLVQLMWRIFTLSEDFEDVTFEDFQVRCKAGDVIQIRGWQLDSWLSRIIQGSCFSHVSVVVEDDNGRKYILDTTPTYGTRLVPRPWKKEDITLGAACEMYWYPVRQRDDAKAAAAWGRAQKLAKIPYSPVPVFGMLCSELVAEYLQALQILPTDVNASKVTPRYLAEAAREAFSNVKRISV